MNKVIYTRFATFTDYDCTLCRNKLNVDEADNFMLCHGCYCEIFDPALRESSQWT
jgi:hypothetical protein